MSFLLPSEAAALDFYWEQLLRLSSGRDHAFQWKLSQLLESGGSAATSAPVTLWVDPTNGSDANSGSQGAPLKSVQRAIDLLPLVLRHACTINVRAGTVAETIIDNHIYTNNGVFTGSLTIFGFDLTTPTITGSLTGTLGSAPATGATWTGSPAVNWSAHALKGMFIQITSGADLGRLYPIADNATNTLDLPTWRSQLNGVTFSIVQLATTVTAASGSDMSFLIAPSSDSIGPIVQRLNVQSGNFYGFYHQRGALTVTECWVDTGTFTGANLYGPQCNFSLNRSFVAGHGTNTGINGNNIGTIAWGASVIDGGSVGMAIEAANWFAGNSSGGLIIQGQSSVGLKVLDGPRYGPGGSAQRILCRNGAVGCRLEGHAMWNMNNMEFTGNSSHGLHIPSNDLGQGGVMVSLGNCQVTGNGGDGIRVESSFNRINVIGSTAISSNTGVGINLISTAGEAPSTHNAAFVGSSVTMASNGNDLSVDGTNFSTVANLRAQAGKFIADASSLFNRLSAQ